MYDYIIIGAGSAGCVLANRLSADGSHTVLLLEAGGPDKHMNIHIPGAYGELHGSPHDWGFQTQPQANVLGRRLYLPRGKTLGGSSSTNAMAYVRGNRADYDQWAAAGNVGWSYQEVLPYFIKSECNQRADQLDDGYHGRDGELFVGDSQFLTPSGQAFIEAGQKVGLPANRDYNGRQQKGIGKFQFTIRDGKRQSAAVAFLKPILDRPNLTAITQARVERIDIENDRAVAVRFHHSGSTITERARREIVLSAGAFQSPQLLMLSGIGDPDQLRQHSLECLKALPGVGSNLQDHLFFPISGYLKSDDGINHYMKPWEKTKAMGRYLLKRSGPFVAGPLESYAFLHTENEERVNMQFHFAPMHVGPGYHRSLYHLPDYVRQDGFSLLPSLLLPKSRGYVGLQSGNPSDDPIIQPNFLSDEDDLRVLVAGGRIALDLVQQGVFRDLVKDLYYPNSSDEDVLVDVILNRLETIYHPVGTCKMGSDEMAVVDEQLRVRGIEGLRVIDASIMPTIVAGNTNAPVMMIAEKGADLILAD